MQLASAEKHWSRKTAKNNTYNAFYASKLQDYIEELMLSQNIPKPKITHADPDHLYLAIAQNWVMRLVVGFVMQGHIWGVILGQTLAATLVCV